MNRGRGGGIEARGCPPTEADQLRSGPRSWTPTRSASSGSPPRRKARRFWWRRSVRLAAGAFTRRAAPLGEALARQPAQRVRPSATSASMCRPELIPHDSDPGRAGSRPASIEGRYRAVPAVDGERLGEPRFAERLPHHRKYLTKNTRAREEATHDRNRRRPRRRGSRQGRRREAESTASIRSAMSTSRSRSARPV